MYRGYTKKIVAVVSILVLIGGLWGGYTHFKRNANAKNITLHQFSQVEQGPFEDGKQYRKLSAKIMTNPAIPELFVKNPGRIQVIEFFNYACFWCQRIHPLLNDWVEKHHKVVDLYRFPVVFNQGWDVLGKAYHVVELLKMTSALDMTFFKAIHQDHLNLADEATLKKFFETQGISNEKFEELYHSFEVAQAVGKSQLASNVFQITVSPSVIIILPSGAYITSPATAGREDKDVIAVLEYLIERELKSLPSNHS